jgi:hypothetical protein
MCSHVRTDVRPNVPTATDGCGNGGTTTSAIYATTDDASTNDAAPAYVYATTTVHANVSAYVRSNVHATDR